MVKIARISKEAGALLNRLVDTLTIDELKDYAVYKKSDGFPIKNLKHFDAAVELYNCGFLIEEPSLTKMPLRLYLTESGWDRFQIAEWSEIGRQIDIEKSGEDFGSW